MKRSNDEPNRNSSRKPRHVSVERPSDDSIELAWSAFVAEARSLLATPSESMSPEQRDRSEAISDALIHLAGYAESLRPTRVPDRDPPLIAELNQRRKRDRRGMGRRLTADRQLADPNAEVMSGDERAFLRRRILEGLHVVRLRVPEAVRPPHERLMASSRPVTSELLRELERLHRAALVPELAIAAGAGAQLWDVECTKTLDVPTDLPRGPYIVLRVAGESMEPLIHSGDLVLVRVDEKAAPDTVVVARDPEHGYVVKQVGRITALGIELRSLNPAFPTLHVPHSTGSVLGTVVLRWREAGTGQ